MSGKREIHAGFGESVDQPGLWRFYAECGEEETSVIVTGGSLLPIPESEAAFFASDWPRLLIAEHLEHCAACAAWRKRGAK